MPKSYVNLMLRISPELSDALEKAATEDYRTLSATVRIAVEQWLERRNKNKDQAQPKVRAVR